MSEMLFKKGDKVWYINPIFDEIIEVEIAKVEYDAIERQHNVIVKYGIDNYKGTDVYSMSDAPKFLFKEYEEAKATYIERKMRVIKETAVGVKEKYEEYAEFKSEFIGFLKAAGITGKTEINRILKDFLFLENKENALNKIRDSIALKIKNK